MPTTNDPTTFTDGSWRDWGVLIGQPSPQVGAVHQRLTAVFPPHRLIHNLRIAMSLTIEPGDAQWELFRAASCPGGEAAFAVATETALTRINTALAVDDLTATWRVHATRAAATADLTVAARDVAGVGTTVVISATARPPHPQRHSATANAAWRRLSMAAQGSVKQAAAASWLLRSISIHPDLPTPGTDWVTNPHHGLPRPAGRRPRHRHRPAGR